MSSETNERNDWESLVAVGRIVKAQGRDGEVVIEPLTDFPGRFVELTRVFLRGRSGQCLPYHVESMRMHKGRPVLKLLGISGIGDAKALCGHEVAIPESELPSLPEGSYYLFQIRGLTVEDRVSGEVGVVEGVIQTGGTDVLVVRRPDGKETLVPLCSEICRHIDPARGRIEIEAPEGLVGLNAN